MRYPDFLKKNDTIGFVAPSFGVTTEPYRSAFQNALRFFQQEYQVKVGENVYRDDGFGISSSSENCGKELTDFYCDPEISLLLSVGGGELMCEILEYTDFEKMKNAAPKWFLGYSDNTNFNFLLPTICDTASLYGVNAGAFGMEPWDDSVCDTYDFLTGNRLFSHNYPKWEKEPLKNAENPLAPYHLTETSGIRATVDSVSLSGRFIGGCLDCLLNLCGTSFDRVAEFNEKYKDDGIIWFLESCDLNPMDVRRGLWRLRNAGWFKYAKAFLIGRPYRYDESFMGMSHGEAVLSQLSGLHAPVLFDLDIGHLAPEMIMVQGGYGHLVYGGTGMKIEWCCY